jgi:hypothetical protein
MITSVDREEGGGYSTMHEYHTFSSGDLKQWIDHGSVFSVDDIRPAEAPQGDAWALWAPDLVYRNERYYLYYPVRVQHSDRTKPDGKPAVSAWIGVATAKSPTGPFQVVNPHMEGTQGIDPAVFIDDDGRAYLYWGSHMAAELAPSMTELATKPKRVDVGTDRFMEASWMTKHDGRYLYSYHTNYRHGEPITAANLHDPARPKSELAWSIGDHPLGPFEYGGVLNYELGTNVPADPKSPQGDFVPWALTQSNHGGVVEYHGQSYLFYHTSALSSWRQDEFKGPGTWTQRSVCIDRLEFDSMGRPLPIQQTVAGVDAVTVDQPFEAALPTPSETDRSGATLFRDVDLGTGYYWASLSLPIAAERVELRLDGPTGRLIGTARPLENTSQVASQSMTFPLRGASGRHDLCVVAYPPTVNEIDADSIRVFAGAPKEFSTRASTD